MNEHDLKAKGFCQHPDGSWSKRKHPPVGAVEASSAQPASLPALERRIKEQPSRARSLVRVSLIACRRRLLDPDAVAFSMKPLTDAIAATLGVDDADPRVEWEWHQIKTAGDEGVLVKIAKA